MDLNYLYHRQQTELMRADAAACRSSRRVHQDLATLFGDMIDGAKQRARERGASPLDAFESGPRLEIKVE